MHFPHLWCRGHEINVDILYAMRVRSGAFSVAH